jgi:hypothetical protein
MIGGRAVGVGASSADPVEQYVERDVEVDDVLEPVVEPALVSAVPAIAMVGCSASRTLIRRRTSA